MYVKKLYNWIYYSNLIFLFLTVAVEFWFWKATQNMDIKSCIANAIKVNTYPSYIKSRYCPAFGTIHSMKQMNWIGNFIKKNTFYVGTSSMM